MGYVQAGTFAMLVDLFFFSQLIASNYKLIFQTCYEIVM